MDSGHAGVNDGAAKEMQTDLLRRVFVHNGPRFQTHDGCYYVRNLLNGVIRRAMPKQRGKSARRADKKLRHRSN